MLEKFIGEKVRIVIYQDNQVIVDMICRELDEDFANMFAKYKFTRYHKTNITELNVIELIKE